MSAGRVSARRPTAGQGPAEGRRRRRRRRRRSGRLYGRGPFIRPPTGVRAATGDVTLRPIARRDLLAGEDRGRARLGLPCADCGGFGDPGTDRGRLEHRPFGNGLGRRTAARRPLGHCTVTDERLHPRETDRGGRAGARPGGSHRRHTAGMTPSGRHSLGTAGSRHAANTAGGRTRASAGIDRRGGGGRSSDRGSGNSRRSGSGRTGVGTRNG